MTSKLSERLLNNQTSTIGQPQSGLAEGESYTVSDKPDRFVCSIFNSLQFFENNNSAIMGKAYIFAATIIITLLFWIKQEFLANLPAIEVVFVAFLFAFIFNYYLINGALFKPFVEGEENSTSIKLCGGYAVGVVACFFYSLNFIEAQTALVIFYASFLLVVGVEIVFFKEAYKTLEIAFAVGAFIGSIITIVGGVGVFWDEPAAKAAEDLSGGNFYGEILAVLSAIFMALIMINFTKMPLENFATLNHIFTMMIVLFVPVFFPIQGVITPDFAQWLILLASGILTAFASLFFIRSFQLESGGRASVFIFLQVAFIFLIEWILSSASGFGGVIGAIITIVCVGLYSQQSVSKISGKGSFARKEDDRLKEMIIINRSDD